MRCHRSGVTSRNGRFRKSEIEAGRRFKYADIQAIAKNGHFSAGFHTAATSLFCLSTGGLINPRNVTVGGRYCAFRGPRGRIPPSPSPSILQLALSLKNKSFVGRSLKLINAGGGEWGEGVVILGE